MGFVGLSLAAVLSSKGTQVYGIEKEISKLEELKNGRSPFYEPDLDNILSKSIRNGTLKFSDTLEEPFDKVDLLFITVGTPTKDGKIDLSSIKSVAKTIGTILKNLRNSPEIVVKSTIAPGTTENVIIPIIEKNSGKKLGEDFHLVTNPEFLREGRAIYDQLNPHVVVIGSHDDKSREIITNFYEKIYNQNIRRMYVNFSTSEMIKYANNAFLATKISFINTIANLCQQIPNTDVDQVAKCIGMDPRIGPEFLRAGPGYGGSCLPKDLDSFISVYKKHGLEPVLFESVKQVNAKQIEEIIKILKQKMIRLQGKTISILGLSFKENSDDIRESRSILLIQRLLKEKCKIRAHDPLAISNTKDILNDKIQYYENESDCIKGADCAIIMTPWSQYGKIAQDKIKQMKKLLIIDTRRILDLSEIKDVQYVALGSTNTRLTKK